jgi:hypothetical protein
VQTAYSALKETNDVALLDVGNRGKETMTEGRPPQSTEGAKAQSALGKQASSLGKSPTPGQLVFNLALAAFGLFVAAILFSFGIHWASYGSVAAGMGLILAGLFIFWRNGKRLSFVCAELRMRRRK